MEQKYKLCALLHVHQQVNVVIAYQEHSNQALQEFAALAITDVTLVHPIVLVQVVTEQQISDS